MDAEGLGAEELSHKEHKKHLEMISLEKLGLGSKCAHVLVNAKDVWLQGYREKDARFRRTAKLVREFRGQGPSELVTVRAVGKLLGEINEVVEQSILDLTGDVALKTVALRLKPYRPFSTGLFPYEEAEGVLEEAYERLGKLERPDAYDSWMIADTVGYIIVWPD